MGDAAKANSVLYNEPRASARAKLMLRVRESLFAPTPDPRSLFPRRLLHDPDFAVGQAVQLVDKLVDLPLNGRLVRR